jgi:predicted chitinase
MPTLLQLAQVCRRAPLARLARNADAFAGVLPLAQATTPRRVAMFLANIAHETDEFRFSEEVWGPTEAQKHYEPPGHLAAKLGNTRPGDGFRFRGRGWLQTTGRANYTIAAHVLSLPLLDNPELLAHPQHAAAAAALFWRMHGCNAFADAGDVKGCRHVVNGGENGLAQVEQYFARALVVLEPRPTV